MHLVLDFGNTRKKAAIFDNERLIEEILLPELSITVFEQMFKQFPDITAGIISSVVDYPKHIDEFLSRRFNYIKLSHDTALPVVLDYKTPKTLGIDRIVLAVAGHDFFPTNNVLVIDAGTCITYDFITNSGVYQGGAISPGLETRFRAMNTFTDRLPLLCSTPIDYFIGKDTNECLLSGVMNGTLFEIDAFIESYKKEYKDCKVIITGGHANYFDKKLKNNIFAVPNLVMIGLNLILKFNLEK